MNVIYTICNSRFYQVMDMMIDSIRRYNDTDIYCIINPSEPQYNIQHKNVYLLADNEFDYRYKSKFIINKYGLSYDNYLYIDTDELCRGSVDPIFRAIESDKTRVHGVIEHLSLMKADNYHRFSKTEYPPEYAAYNAGNFGFNKILLPQFHGFLEFIEHVKSSAVCDQPIFNEYFASNITPSLSPYFRLKSSTNSYDALNKNRPNYIFTHYLGAYTDANQKQFHMRRDYENTK